MSCPCDQHQCPAPLTIMAGLSSLPRSLGMFPAWRLNLLAAVGGEPALRRWRAREPGDFGVMLIEMGAYVFDVTSFYDQLVANESYLATALLPGTQRRHVALLGYRPRPAFGSLVWLAAEADGTRLLQLPAGTAIRSGEFNGNPTQVFELDADATIEPRVNRFTVERVPATALPAPTPAVTVEAASVRIQRGDWVVLECDDGALELGGVAAVRALRLRSRASVAEVRFATALQPSSGATYAGSRLLRSGASCGTWKLAPGTNELAVLDGNELSLDSRLNLAVGEIVIVDDGSAPVVRRITAVAEVAYTMIASLTSTITDAGGNKLPLVSAPVQCYVTRLTFDSTLPFAATTASQLVVRHTMVDAATLYAPLKDTLAQGDPISVPALIDPPRVPVTELLLDDVHGEGVVTTGTLDATAHAATGDSTPAWGQELWAPVTLYGNVVPASRGESVHGEQLGSGDGSLPSQTFRLRKKPLTYLAAANQAGRKTTLVIHVGGISWQEVPSFFGVDDHETVYVVRHDDAGNTDVEFGGGARLPTGAAVVADYRFGAGAALPPADSVKQLKRPVAGLRTIRNVLPAFGGADAEGPAELAVRGPQSALLLGRAISLPDFQVAAARQPGVRAAVARWSWDGLGQRPAVVVTYIGDAQIALTVLAALLELAEDDAPINVVPATDQPARLAVDVAIDPQYVATDVIAALSVVLFGAVTLPGSGGLLRPERLGPDGVLFESAVVRAVMDVPGVVALNALNLDATPFIETGRVPASGAYFDFEAGGVWINGQPAS